MFHEIRGSVFLFASTAVAQTPSVSLSAVNITIDPTSTDTYTVQGTFAGLPFSNTQSVVLSLGQFSGTIPLSSFAQQDANVLAYQDATGLTPYWVSNLTLDLNAQTFTAQASGIVLAGLPNPFSVQLGTDQATACVMARVGQTDTGTYQLTSGDGVAEPCAVSTPIASPPRVPAGAQTTVTVTAARSQSANLQVFRADGNAQPVGSPLCTLADTSGGTSACSFDLNESVSGEIPMLVQGSMGSRTILSPGFSVQVVKPVDDASARQFAAIQSTFADAGQQSFAQYGDSVAARVATLVALRTLLQSQPGLTGQPVALTGDGLSIGVRPDAGMPVTFLLNDLSIDDSDTATSRAPLRAAVVSPAPRPTPDRQTFAANQPPLQCGQYSRNIVVNNKVLLWNPWRAWWPNSQIGALIIDPLLNSVCPHFDVTQLNGSDADESSLATFSQYGTIVMVTHGGVDPYNHFVFVTGQLVPHECSNFDNPTTCNVYDIGQNRGIICVPIGEPGSAVGCFVGVYQFNPQLLAGLPANNTLIFAGMCEGFHGSRNGMPLMKAPFPDLFAPTGSHNSYYGFSGPVKGLAARDTGQAVFNSLTRKYSNSDEALAAGEGAFGGGGMEMQSEPNLAYVGNPMLTSPNMSAPYKLAQGASLTFKATLDGTTSCDPSVGGQYLSCQWTNTPAAVGHPTDLTMQVSGQDNFENQASDADFAPGPGNILIPTWYARTQYAVSMNPLGVMDEVIVDFLPDKANPPAARACAMITGPPVLQVSDAFDELQDNGSITHTPDSRLPITVTMNAKYQSPGIGSMAAAYAQSTVTQTGASTWVMEVKGQGYKQGNDNQLVQDTVGVVVSFPTATAGSEIRFSGIKGSGLCGFSVGADATDAQGNSVGHLSSNNNPAGQLAALDLKAAARAHLTLSISAPAGNGGPNPCDAVAQIDVIGKAP